MADAKAPSARISQRQRLELLWSQLKLERSPFDFRWRDTAEHFDPTQQRFFVTDRNMDRARPVKIIDSTGSQALQTLQSGMHAGLTSPVRPWFTLTTPDPDLAKFKPVQQYLHDVTQRMFAVMQLSNLYTSLPILYGHMGMVGTSAMGVLDDSKDLFRCYPYPIGSYVLGCDRRGMVSTFMREYRRSVGQVVEEFGGADGQPLERGDDPDFSRFPDFVKTAWDRGQYETPVDLFWAVLPNRDQDLNAFDARRFPWTSVHYLKDWNAQVGEAGGILRESGFEEFPIMGPRWFVNSEDTYATNCPGMTALGDVKQLYTMIRRQGQAIEKLINPPLVAPTTARTQQVSLVAGGVTYADVREGQQGIKPIHEIRPDLAAFQVLLGDVRGRISEAFFVDLFRMLSALDEQRGSQPPTAREIDERHEEKMLMLGPVVTRTTDDLIKPLIDRLFAMMHRNHLLPPAPDELHGVELVTEPISVLAQAQKLAKVPALDSFVQRVGGMLSADPGVVDKVDTYGIVDEYADIFGVNPRLVRSDDEAAARAQAKQQQAQAQLAAERVAKIGAGAKALANAQMGTGSALDALLGNENGSGA